MRIGRLYLIGLILLGSIIITPLKLYALEDRASVDSLVFEISDSLIIPRYRTPDIDVYNGDGWFDNLSVGLYTNQVLPVVVPSRHNRVWAYDFYWGAYISKGINAYNNIRFDYDLGMVSVEGGETVNRSQLGIDFLWDMSNFYFGYSESRPWSLSLLSGVDFGRLSTNSRSYTYKGVHAGLQVRANISPRTFFFLEPRLSAYTNANRDRLYKIDVNGNVSLGVATRITSPYRSLQSLYSKDESETSFTDDLFVQFGLGSFDVLPCEGATFGSEVNPNFQISLGRWFNPKLALRGSLYAMQGYQLNVGNRIGAMGEWVLNIPGLFGIGLGRFGAELSTGVRYDVMSRSNRDVGSTTALQLKYFMNKQFALFVEERYSSVYKGALSGYHTFTNFNLGVELYKSSFNRYNVRRMTMGNIPYRSQYFASIGYGQIYPFLMAGDWRSMLSEVVDLSVGYCFNEYHALRLKSSYSNFNSRLDAKLDWIMLSPQYVFNVSNWWLGNTTHRFSMHSYFGPLLSLSESDYFGHGVELGMPIAWRLTSGFELFIEPSFRYTRDNLLGYNKGLLGLSGGLTYVQGPVYLVRYLQRFFWGKDWTLAGFGGLQQDLSSWGSQGVTKLPVGNLAIGRWFGPLGVRLSTFGALNRARSLDGRNLMMMSYAGGRIEGMVNMVSLFSPSDELRRFEFDVLAGYHTSLIYRPSGAYTRNWAYAGGMTAALQLKYYVSDDIGVFVEPRYTNISYERKYRELYGEKIVALHQDVTELSMGLEIRQHNLLRKNLRKSYRQFSPRSFVSGVVGYSYPFHYNSARPKRDFLKKVSPNFAINYGRECNAINTYRVGIECYNLRSLFSEYNNFGLALNAEYMPSLTNGMIGYDSTRIVDVRGIVGTNVLYSSYMHKSNWGYHGGAQLEFHVTEDVDLYIEGRLAFYYKPTIVANMRTVRRVGIMPALSSGFTYKF